jgi:hypothetical protein
MAYGAARCGAVCISSGGVALLFAFVNIFISLKPGYIPIYRKKVVHIYNVERGWSGANEHFTQQKWGD